MRFSIGKLVGKVENGQVCLLRIQADICLIAIWPAAAGKTNGSVCFYLPLYSYSNNCSSPAPTIVWNQVNQSALYVNPITSIEFNYIYDIVLNLE